MKEERKRILKMVEEGKLSVDEALSLLDELEKEQKTMEQKQEQIINELSTAVHFQESKKEDPLNAKFQSTKEKIFDFVDSALKKIKDMDFDLNFGQSIDISHIFQHGDAEIRDMDIDVANGSVKLSSWDQPDVRVECQAKVYRVESQEQARENFLHDVAFSLESGRLRFATQQKWMKVDAVIYLPKADFDKTRIRVFNGTVTGSGLKANELRVKTANGKVVLEDINGKKAEIETANGKITVSRSQFDELEAETINGAITLEGDFKKTEAVSFNGAITTALSGTRSEWVHAKTTTGTIELSIPESTSIKGELKTNLGGFNLQLVGVQILEEKSEMVQKSLRFQSANQTDIDLKIYADTKTGSITVKKSIH
ncbi:DUF4097 family beta strand repeat-containing protein [Neobacillus dielmonensis]|uniref:DUF4097 family beta strand repeat-containing protein n=1 Tax=Neobacillus dielmonensis TaxID=1347369 RepID=UPI0005AA81DE|nr:DUF4097 domain-containing protein [Neobacillus dielmonensis]